MIDDQTHNTDFLFTCKPEKWPYAKLKTLIDDFESGKSVTENWRCRAVRKIRPGSKGYLLKQGKPRGIFGIATITGFPRKRPDAKPEESQFEVPLTFNALVDPTKRFLIHEEQLLKLPVPSHRWKSMASGMPIEPDAARIIDQIITKLTPAANILKSTDYDLNNVVSSSRSERLVETYARNQSLVDELKRIYQGHCQICGSLPFNGFFGNISEGHHIKWLCRGGDDKLENMILLCPNHHAAIHATDPEFDADRLVFKFGGKELPIRFNQHLKSN